MSARDQGERSELAVLVRDYEVDPGPNACRALGQKLFDIGFERLSRRLSPEDKEPLEGAGSLQDSRRSAQDARP